jgi:RNA polymerase sigma-B factor
VFSERTQIAAAQGPPSDGASPRVGRRRTLTPADDLALFRRHRRRPSPETRARLVERFLPLARHLARRYDGTGQSFDDIYQVACLALVKAVDRYDPDRGVAFSSYAVPTMVGEVKRYFRDQTWAVHIPRELQERSLRVSRAVAALSAPLGREPTVREVADETHLTEEDVLEALCVATAYRADSLEAPQALGADHDITLGEAIGYEDERFIRAERRADLAAVVCRLAARERAALTLRFEYGLTQAEIGRVLGVSQMHVSRILRGSLDRLRKLEAADRRRADRRSAAPRASRRRSPAQRSAVDQAA